MFQRSTAGDDVIDCPICKSRDGLKVSFISKTSEHRHDETIIGCENCDKWFSAKESKWAYTDWNIWACDEWLKHDVVIQHQQLYKLLHEEHLLERQLDIKQKEINIYLENEIASRCEWKVGDRFEAKQYPFGIWQVDEIEAVYGTNTGPFWRLYCFNVKFSGRIGNNRHEFWQRDKDMFEPIKPFWRPSKWCQVYVGDECIFNNRLGKIVNFDKGKKVATIEQDSKFHHVIKLRDLLVPTARLTENDT